MEEYQRLGTALHTPSSSQPSASVHHAKKLPQTDQTLSRMPERKAWFAAPGCLVVIAILALIGYGLYVFLRPGNVTQVEGDLSGGMVQNEALLNFEPELNVDLHGDSCWAVIASLAITIVLIISAIVVIPRIKEHRTRKKAEKEQVTSTLSALVQQNEDQRLRAEEDMARIKEAHKKRMQSLSIELDQIRGETRAVAAVHHSRGQIQT